MQDSPILSHLIELRDRLVKGLAAWVFGFAVAYTFKEPIYGFLLEPLAEAFGEGQQRRLIYTSLPETFFTYVKLSMFSGFCLAFPVVAYQLYGFIAPGLYRKEKRVLVPYLILSPLLFALGMALAYYYVFPLAWKFFIGFEEPAASAKSALPLAVVLEARVSDYLSLVIQMLLAFGLAFQLPVVLTLLAYFELIQSDTLKRFRKFALVGIVTAAAIFTPPDVISQLALAIPLLILYELSIVSCRLIEKKQAK